MNKQRQLIIFGDSAFAEIAYEYFTHDSTYEVVAFTVEQQYLKQEHLLGLPVVPFETLELSYSPATHDVFAAVTYTQLNRLRARVCHQAKEKGYSLASYVSSKAFVWQNVKMGEHCFIFENNVVQPFVQLGNNVILWSGNHIGHHSVIKDHCFISSHVVISGFVEIGENCFFGVNATIANNIKIAKDCWISPSVTIMKDTKPGELYKGSKAEATQVNTYKFFKVTEE
jgi:sugar O-acyltransferase (sialic acid O-acetyltransferase NeuD family)